MWLLLFLLFGVRWGCVENVFELQMCWFGGHSLALLPYVFAYVQHTHTKPGYIYSGGKWVWSAKPCGVHAESATAADTVTPLTQQHHNKCSKLRLQRTSPFFICLHDLQAFFVSTPGCDVTFCITQDTTFQNIILYRRRVKNLMSLALLCIYKICLWFILPLCIYSFWTKNSQWQPFSQKFQDWNKFSQKIIMVVFLNSFCNRKIDW